MFLSLFVRGAMRSDGWRQSYCLVDPVIVCYECMKMGVLSVNRDVFCPINLLLIQENRLFCVCSEGDFRMVIGEDKSKVANIVKDNLQHFKTLYSNILRDCPQLVYKPQQGKLEVC